MDDRDTDDVLLATYSEGAPTAARLLMDRHASRLMSFAVRMLGDRHEAEDVVQEAMLRLWKIAPDWEPGRAQVSTWLYRVASNLCTDRLRKRRTVHIDMIPEPEDATLSVAERMQNASRLSALELALGTLPERQRQAVVLRHLEGLSNPEIAVIMDVGVEAVESLTARGKRALKAALAGQREELGYADE